MNDLVDPKKLAEFANKVDKMALEEFGLDDCGGYRVTVRVLDRSRHWPMHWFPVPYEHKTESIEELDKCLDRYLTNLSIATEEMDKYLKTRAYEVRRIEKKQ